MSSVRMREIRRFTIAGGASCHRAFPGLLKLSSGEMLVAYREGSDHWITEDGVVKIVRSSDGGVSWSEPELIFAESGWSCGVHHGPGQLSDGRIFLPVTSLRRRGGERAQRAHLLCSEDEGKSWEDPILLGPMEGWVWQNQYGRVQEFSDGRVFILGGGQKIGEEPCYSGYFVSYDGGETFPERVHVACGLADELDVAQMGDGRLIAMIRDGKPHYLHRAYSVDEGRTWSEPERTEIIGHCPSLLVLPSGTLFLGHRQVNPSRNTGCTISASTDGGETWQLVSDIDTSPVRPFEPLPGEPGSKGHDCSYPSMIMLEDGRVFCAYYTVFQGGNSNIEGLIFEVEE